MERVGGGYHGYWWSKRATGARETRTIWTGSGSPPDLPPPFTASEKTQRRLKLFKTVVVVLECFASDHVLDPEQSSLPSVFRQSVVCGEGMRYRNLSCFVSDGSADGEFSMVDEELCSSLELAVNGDKQILLKEPCTLPCPGKTAGPPGSGGWGRHRPIRMSPNVHGALKVKPNIPTALERSMDRNLHSVTKNAKSLQIKWLVSHFQE